MPLLSYFITVLAYYVAVTAAFFVLSIKVPVAGFVARCLAAYACLMTCATYGVFASIALRLVGYGQISQWAVARAFKWTMLLTTGMRFVIVEGEEYLSTRPAVLIGNHQTELDVLLLGITFPRYCSVTAKKSLRHIPFLGWFMALSGTVFIDRGNRQTARKAFDGAAATMRDKRHSVFIFPEGTRTYSAEPSLLPFKKGAFHLAVQAGVDIVPIVAENYSHLLNVKKLRFKPGTVRVKILPPIRTKDLTAADVDDLTQRTRESMLNTVEEMYKTRDSYQANGHVSHAAPASQAMSTAIET